MTDDMAREMVMKLTSDLSQKYRQLEHRRLTDCSGNVGLESSNKPRRQRATDVFVPQQTRSSSMEDSDARFDSVREKEQQHKGLRRDYSLGETVRSPSHIIIEKSTSEPHKLLTHYRSMTLHFSEKKRCNFYSCHLGLSFI